MDNTKIEWTDATWNIITGCSVVSAGCKNCYAMKLAGTRLQHHSSRAGLTIETQNGPVWNGQVRFNEQWLLDPLKWSKPRMIFVCAHGDLFHESVPDQWIDRVFAVMAIAKQHVFQVLTKRPERLREYLRSGGGSCIRVGIRHQIESMGFKDIGAVDKALPNIWLGVSVEDQKTANERIPLLLDTPAAVRWISAEPLLGSVELSDIPCPSGIGCLNCLTGDRGDLAGSSKPWLTGLKLDWVVVGGESGSGARPMHPDWARSLRDQCAAAGVPFLFKQWGEWGFDPYPNSGMKPYESITMKTEQLFRCGKKRSGRLLDGVQHDGYPK